MSARRLAVLTLALLATAAVSAHAQMRHGAGQGQADLERLVVESADTPDEHQALAGYYQGKAEHMRDMAGRHQSMGKAYAATKMMERERMKRHCEEAAASFEKAATEFDAMAQAHRDMAGAP